MCPSHPLDGCTTVDYGAFGMTHDNRITFEGPAGPGALVQLDFAFSNIDDNAPDGSTGPRSRSRFAWTLDLATERRDGSGLVSSG